MKVAVVVLALVACGAAEDSAGLDAGDADSEPFELSEEALAFAESVAIDAPLSAPDDPTNAFADDSAAAALGHKLFFDPRFSGPLRSADNNCVNAMAGGALGLAGQPGRVACASCHVPGPAEGPFFVDTRSTGQTISLAADWVLRRTPGINDVAHSSMFMWDGRRDALHTVSFGAIESPDEMNSGRLFYAKQVAALYAFEYESAFGVLPDLGDTDRFPDIPAAEAGCIDVDGDDVCRGKPGDGSDFDLLVSDEDQVPEDGRAFTDQDLVTEVVANAGKALDAYMRNLSCGPGRFDAWALDEGELSDEELLGLEVFVGKGQCAGCHSGPLLSDHKFHNVGLKPETVAVTFLDIDDAGAAPGVEAMLADPLASTGKFSDGVNPNRLTKSSDKLLGAFRTPILRCRSEQPSFFHTGHVRSMAEVIEHFDRGGDQFGFLGKSELADEAGEPIPLELTDEEKQALEAFLRTLDGTMAPELLEDPVGVELEPVVCE